MLNCVRRGAIYVTMYNFGSPRVGNRRFAELYNEVFELSMILAIRNITYYMLFLLFLESIFP